jgi:2-polyprenyl-3-methyl-5-hydroxy-6-metoxy-1,4-benzoquinol methylase
VGCGHGASTILMALAYPHSQFVGFDYHGPSVGWARRAASKAGATNAAFEVATVKDFHGAKHDLVAFFDCLHDMGDPVGAPSHVKEMLNPDGAWMIVEPFAKDKLEDNLNLAGARGRAVFGRNRLVKPACAKWSRIGFTHFRRAAETPFNLVFEAKL